MKISGHGGFWAVAATGEDAEYDVVVHNASYEVETRDDVRETRSAGCKGWTEGLPRAKRVESARFRVSEDDVSYPQALGFTEGVEVTFWLKRGALDEFDRLHDAIVESVRISNDQQKARWVEIVCRYGRYERGAEPPVLPPPDPEPDPDDEEP